MRDHETSFTMNKLYIIFFTLAFATTETAFAKSSSSKVFEVSDWSVFAEANPKQCWATTIPSNSITSRNSKKVKVKRNDVALMVVFDPKAGVNGQLVYTAGYPFAPGASVQLTVGAATFFLFTNGEWAWAKKGEDKKIIDALARSNKATAISTSSRGTRVADEFSLSGSRKAIIEAANRCNFDTASLQKRNPRTTSETPSVDRTNQTKRKTCADDVSLCSIQELCKNATQLKNGRKVWSQSGKQKRYVEYAKANGLSCNTNTFENTEELVEASYGSGFFINANGHIVTNEHVIDGCEEVKLHNKKLAIIAKDGRNDLAVLKSDAYPTEYLTFKSQDASLADDVIAAGYPFGDSFSSSLKVTKGIVSSIVGIDNDASRIQIDAALQPGNSGGPIVNPAGEVIAVSVSKLDAGFTLENFGVLPENTNFGIKVSTLKTFLNSQSISFTENKISEEASLGKLLNNTTVPLTCWKRLKDMEQN